MWRVFMLLILSGIALYAIVEFLIFLMFGIYLMAFLFLLLLASAFAVMFYTIWSYDE